MDNEVLTAILALIGTAIGTGGGIIASSKLTNYRLKKLEEKVDKHNQFAERIPLIEKDIKIIYHIIDEMQDK